MNQNIGLHLIKLGSTSFFVNCILNNLISYSGIKRSKDLKRQRYTGDVFNVVVNTTIDFGSIYYTAAVFTTYIAEREDGMVHVVISNQGL